jgi:hypothetical protein
MVDAQRRWAAGPLPGRTRRILLEASPAAVGQLPFLDWKHRTVLDLNVPHDANAADLIGELHVVAPGLDARDAQALVVVDSSIAIILALSGPQLSVPAGDIWRVVIV